LYEISTDPDEMHNLAEVLEFQDELDEMKLVLKDYLQSFPGRPFGEFIPGTNASAPNPVVVNYIRNIQDALRNGATLDVGTIVCEGNCVTTGENTSSILDASDHSARIFQDSNYIKIIHLENFDELKIYDVSGREVSRYSCSDKETMVLNKSDYAPGTYMITLQSHRNEVIQSSKIIIN
jgi:hypothetical protein